MAETITGTRGSVALKIFGEDLNTLEQLGQQAQSIISSVKGASETQIELISGAEELPGEHPSHPDGAVRRQCLGYARDDRDRVRKQATLRDVGGTGALPH